MKKLLKIVPNIKESNIHLRALASISFALFFLAFMPKVFNTLEILYYSNISISNFISSTELFVPDVCIGDKNQPWNISREIKGTELGWPAVTFRRLYLTKYNEDYKVYEQRGEPFLSVKDNGVIMHRLQELPSNLEPGYYQWRIAVTVILPHDVFRNDVPEIYSNYFNVKTCN